jgi:hypothetical protein
MYVFSKLFNRGNFILFLSLFFIRFIELNTLSISAFECGKHNTLNATLTNESNGFSFDASR